MTTILIAGATGFIGHHTLNWLSGHKGIRLIAACRDRKRLPADFQAEVREGDIRDPDYLEGLLDGVDVIVNAVAWTSLHGHADESERLFYRPTRALIDAFMRSRASRFVNISTTSAAAPDNSADAMSHGIERPFWPHLCNVVRIEEALRAKASSEKTVINLRLGLFVGEHYALGLLPILLPRLKTHLVPWVAGGKTQMPLTDGRDLGQAMGRAAMAQELSGYNAFNIVGTEVPSVRDVFLHLHEQYGFPKPHFGVPFPVAYPFAWLMEKLDPLVPWDPLIVRSIIHLLQNTDADNTRAMQQLGYRPQYHWHESIRLQIDEMNQIQTHGMKMAREVR